MVRHVASEEVELSGETEADYFRVPGLALKGTQDEAVGSGLDTALLTPVRPRGGRRDHALPGHGFMRCCQR